MRTKVAEHSVVLNDDDVRALLDGRKTQLRLPVDFVVGLGKVNKLRKIESSNLDVVMYSLYSKGWWGCSLNALVAHNPYGGLGDILYVREAWCTCLSKAHYSGNPDDHGGANNPCWGYRATLTYRCGQPISPETSLRWRASTQMSRAASRIDLEIITARAEWLQDITYGDCMAMGIDMSEVEYRPGWDIAAFRDYWDACYATRGFSYDSNPLVWVFDVAVTRRDVVR